MVLLVDSVARAIVERVEDELRSSLARVREATADDASVWFGESPILAIRSPEEIEVLRDAAVSLVPTLSGLESGQKSMVYGEFQDHMSSLSSVLLLEKWPERGQRNRVRSLIDEAMTRLLAEQWMLDAGTGLRDFFSMDLGFILAESACAEMRGPESSLEEWQLPRYATALRETYRLGVIPYGWVGAYPGAGGPLKARLGATVTKY